MLEAAELGAEVSKDAYREAVEGLRTELLNVQYDCRFRNLHVIVIVVGDDRRGCNEVVHQLHEWMDGRYLRTEAFGPPTEEERQRPPYWRYWMALPRYGQIGIYLGGLMLDGIRDRVEGAIDEAEFDRRARSARHYAEMLGADGALVLRFWLHLPRKEFRKRLKKEQKSSNGWRVEEEHWHVFERYDEAMPVVERMLRKVATPHASTFIVESTDERHRNLSVGRTLLAALADRLGRENGPSPEPDPGAVGALPSARHAPDFLASVDLSARLEREEYKRRLEQGQGRLRALTARAREAGRSSVLAFEGWDAAGKGGAIRRIANALDVRDVRVIPIAAPTDEEQRHHYLWRFWRRLPRAGRVLVFDRSWYGRVLVERVEGLAREDEWRRAYEELNDFEEQLVSHGTLVLKFWLHIDPDEQLRRFREREQTPYKKYKLTKDDFRNREKWDAYSAAVNEMVARTSTDIAPWQLVAANDKRWARVQILEEFCNRLEKALGEG